MRYKIIDMGSFYFFLILNVAEYIKEEECQDWKGQEEEVTEAGHAVRYQ